MTGTPIRTAALALGCGALLIGLAACDGEQATSAPVTTGPSAPIAGSQVTPTPSATASAAPTCESIIPPETVAAFSDTGWTSRQDPFFIGNIELPDGLQCIWGDPKVASDNVQVYGWAPLSTNLAEDVANELTVQGWDESTEGDATYFLPSDQTPMGMAYRMTGDELTVSDTKQGLLLVEWPPAG